LPALPARLRAAGAQRKTTAPLAPAARHRPRSGGSRAADRHRFVIDHARQRRRAGQVQQAGR
jgi:hypothetical protein